MPDNEIKLKIVIDDKEAIASLKLTDDNIKELYNSFKYGQQEVNGLVTSISRGFNNAREIIQGFREAFSVISQSFSTHLIAYQEQESALIKLTTVLKQTGNYTEENYKALVDYSAQLQRTTIYGDELTQSVMAQLLAMGLSVEQTKQATLQAANLATVMGTDLNTAARAMADLFNGNTGLISRYVKGLDETIIKSGDLNKILAMLNERIGGQAVAMGQSAAGAIAKMNNAIGDLRENTGALLSQALAPIVASISDIISKVNDTSPQLSALIGLIGSLTTAFVTLRVTGLLPAIHSIELFGIALTGLKAALVKSGIGALIIGLGYAFWELSKAYEHYKSVQMAALDTEERITSEIQKHSREQLEWGKQDLERKLNELETRKKQLELEKNRSYEIQINKDKEGNEYTIRQETEKTNKINEQLRIVENQIDANKRLLNVYEKQLNTVNMIKKIDEEKTKKYTEFEKKQIDYELGIISKDEYRNWLVERINSLGATYQEKELIIQLRKELEKLKEIIPEIPELEIITSVEEPPLLPDIQYGNTLEYARLTKEQELEIWREKEIEKVKTYENAKEMIQAIDEEYLRRKRELALEENMIYSSLKEGFESAASAVASAGAEAVRVFKQANSVLQIFINSLVQAFVQTLALKAVMSTLNFITGGISGIFTSIASIPAAAEGAVVTKPTLMLVGEGRYPEGVFPLPYLNQLAQSKPAQVNVNLNIEGAMEIDGYKIRSLLRKIEREIKINR